MHSQIPPCLLHISCLLSYGANNDEQPKRWFLVGEKVVWDNSIASIRIFLIFPPPPMDCLIRQPTDRSIGRSTASIENGGSVTAGLDHVAVGGTVRITRNGWMVFLLCHGGTIKLFRVGGVATGHRWVNPARGQDGGRQCHWCNFRLCTRTATRFSFPGLNPVEPRNDQFKATRPNLRR